MDRISQLAGILRSLGLADKVLIEVDGGINQETSALVRAAGATVLVAGTYFYGAEDKQRAVAVLKGKQ